MTKIMLIKDRNTFNTKWVCNFASQLQMRGYDVVLVSDSYSQSGAPVPINKQVKKINLSAPTANLWRNLWLRLRSVLPLSFLRYRRLFAEEKPDIIICYFTRDLVNATFLQKHKIPLIMMMHNPPNEIFANVRRGLYRLLVDKAFQRADVVQVLMKGFQKEVTDVYPHKKVRVISNQVMQPEVCCDLTKTHHTIIHVAQIAEQFKRQHLLIEAFAKIAADFPTWKVKFFGRVKTGKHERYFRRLQNRVKELNLEERLLFQGYSNNITQEYLQADIVTLPSYSEGFGYGLADGLALGLPGVGFADAPAINELIIDGKTGYLVKDIDDYAAKLAKLMRNQELRCQMGKAARADMARFSPQTIIAKWIELIEETLKND